ncbi:MAG: helix-turn-helix domain-containing protein [Prevotellaceae bacterium]|jgi:YesN/AraC family two-component response regulator|nr:helix-turn-helix domain-containing protein [Prevotellaceae bacterium]
MKKVFPFIVVLLTFAATAQEIDSLQIREYPWSMNFLYYPRTPGCDSIFADDFNEIRYYNSDSIFYKMATQGRTFEVEDLLHHLYYQILEDYASREKIDEEYRKMREAAKKYNSSLLEDEADYMEIYFMHADNDSLWNIKDERMNELMRKAAKSKQYANECRLTFELFHACLNHRQYDRAFKYAAILLDKMKNMTNSDYFNRRSTYLHIGNAYYLFRDYPRAIECFRITMQEGARRFADRSGLMAKEKMAQYYASINQLDSSDYYYRSLYNSPEQVRYRPHYDLIAMQGLASNAIKRGEYGKALSLLKKIHPAILKLRNISNIATNTYLLGICYLETKRLDIAKSMIDSTRVMLMKSKIYSQIYPIRVKTIDFRLKDWYDLMSRYSRITGKRELEYAYRDSVYIIDSELREETNTLVILRAEQELFETQKQLAAEQIRIRNYRIAVITVIFLFTFITVLIFIYLYGKTQKAYRQLVAKNIEWANIHNNEISKPVSEISENSRESNIMKNIYRLFEKEKIYTDSDLSLPKLAERLNISHRNYVSEAINTICKCNFNTFVNDYRIKFAIKLLNNSKYDKYSFEQIAEMAGFSNRQSFYTSFKNKTGLTPATFRSNRQQS